MVKVAISIISQSKVFDFTRFPDLVGTLNSLSFLLLRSSCVYTLPKRTIRGLGARQIMAYKETAGNELLRSLSS